MNKVILKGRLGSDAELKYTAQGKAVANLSVATSKKYKKEDGTKGEITDWHNVTLYGKIAESVQRYSGKGKRILIEGELKTNTWEKDGVKQYKTFVQGERIDLIDFVKKEVDGNIEHKTLDDDFTPKNNPAYSADDIPF